jgi:hypothetical protein
VSVKATIQGPPADGAGTNLFVHLSRPPARRGPSLWGGVRGWLLTGAPGIENGYHALPGGCP